ncbi:MAG: tRNA pseudouridine(55) synthase TruB [Saprospiraceae bacterium]|nr:tRNA pseudouridine(55) synthase TruB [Saprospiraceae bacterium]MBK6476783.1 tRNA pseudouridine(55) synthase TruB [Saprospiraceae bacterium]MBK6816193.1 tRNA pseudouridine(55) synthase TruB [Saprospiraceae bacterium]MBK7370304.1 tRNA pseudouridine(55) synthase TruB [Saprospiraceae bacterium]MBK7438012.1 tRNA pseudouridine(55) synthase TruB [Saprospiraceae bacterium]
MSETIEHSVINPLKINDDVSDIDQWHEGRLILINKPLDWTSYDLVHKCKLALNYNLGIKKIKIGHAGTLDPKASGLMIILTGKFTKLTDSIHEYAKNYQAQIFLGGTTPCYDSERPIDTYYPIGHITEGLIRETALKFVGKNIKQYPPIFSAVRINGKKAYRSAHKGLEVITRPRFVDIHELTVRDINLPIINMDIKCSSGTYIRSLAYDLGGSVGSGAYLYALSRTQIGPWKLGDAMALDDFVNLLKSSA